MPPEETPAQPAPEPPTPAIEAPVSAPEPTTPPETPSAPAEPAQTSETAQPMTPTAQIPPNEPLPPELEPIEPEPEPIQPPSAAAPVQTGVLHTAPAVAKAMSGTRDFLVKARIAIQDRKRKKRDKIMEALATKTKITNDEVEKLLHVSDATATRYLSTLEKEGKIIQVGKQGKGILYIKTP